MRVLVWNEGTPHAGELATAKAEKTAGHNELIVFEGTKSEMRGFAELLETKGSAFAHQVAKSLRKGTKVAAPVTTIAAHVPRKVQQACKRVHKRRRAEGTLDKRYRHALAQLLAEHPDVKAELDKIKYRDKAGF